jgi:hypothetical protein
MSKVTYLIGNASCLAIIPKELARKQGIDNSGTTVIEEIENGLVIKKQKGELEIEVG